MPSFSFVAFLASFLLVSSNVCASPFEYARTDRALTFPRDHGSHPSFRTEWWYLTGILDDRYGFQLTFFRRSDEEGPGDPDRQSWLAHAAFSDFSGKKFLTASRTARGGLDIGGAFDSDLVVWNHRWKIERLGSEAVIEFELDDDAGKTTEVRLIAELPRPLLHGEAGFSRKGRCPECASHYYSFPSVPLRGVVRRAGGTEDVRGRGWFDHEFMSGALEKGQVGWDWFSVMGTDGSSLMVYRVRGAEPFYAGTFRAAPDAPPETFDRVSLTELETWKSSVTGGVYPIRWKLDIPVGPKTIELAARLPNQEVPALAGLTPPYWEGAVRSPDGRYSGYLEMTGYAAPLAGGL